MRIAVAVLVTLSLIAPPSGEANAREPTKKRSTHASVQTRQSSSASALAKPDVYIERDTNKLPFGSSAWWDQMLRENRAGQCCN